MTTRPSVDEADVSRLLIEARQDGIEKLVVGAVVVRDGKFLLLKRAADDFMGGLVELPSGGVDEGEEMLVALRREAREETGLAVSPVAYLGSFDYLSGSGRKARQFNFLVTAAPGGIKLNPAEHSAYCFLSSDEASAHEGISPEVRGVLRAAENAPSEVSRSA